MEMTKEREMRLRNIIEALGTHEDAEAIRVLEEMGTNCESDEVREWTSRALIQRNTHESLCHVILNKGKGINDLSPRVAMSAINDILELKDKTEAIRILEDTMKMHSDEEVREAASSVRALIALGE